MRVGERYGRRQIVAMLAGDTRELSPNLVNLSIIGLLRHEQPQMLQRWIDTAVDAGLIAVTRDKYRILSVTPRGRDVMSGRTPQVQLRAPLRSPPLSWRDFRPNRRFGYWSERFSEDL